ncbi:sulfotransferase [Rhodothermus marinus]|uniref:sulfotransferase n=1 Tax=Rhodothermus marinus TaxID=29549 RepID=UPI0037C9496E
MKIPVIYIAGWGRSGSTLLGNMLGSIEGLQHIGETPCIWEHAWKYNHLCGCGMKLQECDFWDKVIRTAYGEWKNIDPDEMIRIRNKYLFSTKKSILRLFKKEKLKDVEKYYLNHVKKLYKSIFYVAGKKIIVDSSKYPYHLILLNEIDEIDLYLIHITRDARGCAYSWTKNVIRNDFDYDKKIPFEKIDPFYSTLRWIGWNVFMDFFKWIERVKYMNVKYEDFAKDPINVLGKIADFVGFKIPWNKNGEIYILKNHTVWGNPSRMRTGKVEIRLDDAWRRNMPLKDRLLVTALSWPWLLKYGYLGKTA